MCAVPRVHRQPGRAEAHRLDELRTAGAEGHGDVGHRSEPEDGSEGSVELAVHPALPRHRVLALDRSGARRRDRRPVRRQGDTGAGRFDGSHRQRRRSDDGDVDVTTTPDTATAGRALARPGVGRTGAQVAEDRPVHRRRRSRSTSSSSSCRSPGRSLQLLRLGRASAARRITSGSATTARRFGDPAFRGRWGTT